MNQAKKLTINIDDFGVSHSADQEIAALLETGAAQSVSVFFTSRRIDEATKILEPLKNKIDLGVHLDLSFGILRGQTPIDIARKNGPEYFWLNTLHPDHVFAEFEAQIRFALNMGFSVTHIDNHRPEIYFFPNLFTKVVDLAQKYDVYLRTPFNRSFPQRIDLYAETFQMAKDSLKSIGSACKKMTDDRNIKTLDHLEMPVLSGDAFASIERSVSQLLDGHTEILCHAGQNRIEYAKDGSALKWAIKENLYEKNNVKICKRSD